MFEDKSEISAVLQQAGLGAWAGAIEAQCRPAVCFEKHDGDGATGSSRIGGEPDMPDDLPWPTRGRYSDWEKVAKRLAHHGPGLLRGASNDQPLHFVAQIDLASAAVLPVRDERLPAEGRLLFFWDVNCGPWTEHANACRVIWDESPPSALSAREAPAALAIDDQMRGFPRVFTETPLAMRGIWSMPDPQLLVELLDDASFRQMLEDGDCDDFWEDLGDARGRVLASEREVLAHRLGGWPIPEQWDPRFAGVAASRGHSFMLGRMAEAETAACEAQMHDWTMLLQVGCDALGFAEGTVYFVLPEADLIARRFDRVHAVFQQT